LRSHFALSLPYTAVREVEPAASHVDEQLDIGFGDNAQGGPEKAMELTPLEEYREDSLERLRLMDRVEVAVGFAEWD
jgi:hypothetical protein